MASFNNLGSPGCPTPCGGGGGTPGHTVVSGCGSIPMPLVINQSVTPPLSGAEELWVADTLTLGAIPADFAGNPSFLSTWWYGATSHPYTPSATPFWYVAQCNSGSVWQVRGFYGTGGPVTAGSLVGTLRRWQTGVGVNSFSPFFLTSSPTKDAGTSSTVTESE